MQQILIIGIGNEMRGDDALGPRVIRELKSLGMEGVRLVEASGEGTSLIETWKGHRSVVLVDAFSSGATPGLTHAIDATTTRVPQDCFHSSSHAFGVAEAIEVSRGLGLLPERILVYGIEAGHFRLGEGLSRPVRERIPEFVGEIACKVSELMHERLDQEI